MNDRELFRILHRSIGDHSYGGEDNSGLQNRQGGIEVQIPDIDEDGEEESDSSDSPFPQESTILCLCRNSKRMAGTLLDLEALSLQFIECMRIEATEEDDLIHTLLIQTMPNRLICNIQVGSMLTSSKDDLSSKDTIFHLSQLKIDIQPAKNFRQREGANFLEVISQKFDSSSDQMSVLKDIIKSKEIDLYSCCITPLIPYMESLSRDVPGRSEYEVIKDITYFNLRSVMVLDEPCIESLRIFNAFGSSKKGSESSIYKLLDKTHTKVGSTTLRKYLLRPLLNLEDIRGRHDSIETVLSSIEGPENMIIQEMVEGLKGMPNIIASIKKLSQGYIKYPTWKSIRSFLIQARRITNSILNCKKLMECPVFEDLAMSFPIEELNAVYTLLEEKLDFSTDLSKVFIKEGVSQVLDDQSWTYSLLESILETTTAEFASQLNDEKLSKAVSTMYIQQLGYLIAIDFSELEQTSFESASCLADMQEVFRSSTCVYYKNKSMLEMDHEFGDIYSIICDLEIEIYHNLSQDILKFESRFFLYYKKVGAVDAIISLSHVALEQGFCKPEMRADTSLNLKRSRHPLYENGIPNDIEIGKNGSNVMVVTGPNYSGKSSLLCQCGITVYLAHIGSYVPAKEAIICLTDRIITRVNSFESIGKTQSTFLIDSSQIMKCLTKSTSKSLILIDEFGKGTDVIDGPALLASVIYSFSSMREKSPKTIVATHFFELFLSNCIAFPYPIDFAYMKTCVDRSQDAKDGITYLYQLEDGLSQNSHGIYCAKNCGIPDDVITRAQRIHECLQNGESIRESQGTLSLDEMISFNNAEKVVQKFLAWDLDVNPSANSFDTIKRSLLDLMR